MSLPSRTASRRLLATGVVGLAAVIGLGAPAQAATHSPAAGNAPTLLGSPMVQEPLGADVVVHGRGPAGSTVDIYFHERLHSGYTRRRTLTADAKGDFSFSYRANDDYRVYAQVGQVVSDGVLVSIRPDIDGPIRRVVPLGQEYTITGTYLPGEPVNVLFHASTDGQQNFPRGSRVLTTDASGHWTRTYKATQDYRIRVLGLANDTFFGGPYLYQAR